MALTLRMLKRSEKCNKGRAFGLSYARAWLCLDWENRRSSNRLDSYKPNILRVSGELRVKYGFGDVDVNDEERGRVFGVIDTFQSEGDPGRQGS